MGIRIVIGAFFVSILVGCSPVRRVLNSPKFSTEVGRELVKRGLCVNDTVYLSDTAMDTLTTVDSFVRVIPFRGSSLDSVFGDVRVRIARDTIYVTQASKTQVITKTIREREVVRDKTLEGILRKELEGKTQELAGVMVGRWTWLGVGFGVGALLTLLLLLVVFLRRR